MNWKNRFEVEAPPDTVFATLVDIPTIAPCMPGAQLTGESDGGYEGTVKVKLGPISAQYRGKARLLESDASARTAKLLAEGSETRGQGTASATITAVCRPAGHRTVVEIDTDLRITGRVAQFGRGVIQDVSAKLIGQFAECLASSVLVGAAAGDGSGAASAGGEASVLGLGEAAAAAPAAGQGAPSVSPPSADAAPSGPSAPLGGPAPSRPPVGPRPTPDAIDLGQVAGGAVAKRVVPVAVALVLLVILWRILRSRSED